LAVLSSVEPWRAPGRIGQTPRRSCKRAGSAVTQVAIRRVPETVPEDAARKAHFKLGQAAPVADPTELETCTLPVFAGQETLAALL
jgi:hypothetical protein